MSHTPFSKREALAFKKGYRVDGLRVLGPSGRVLKASPNRNGYPFITISVNGSSEKVRVHRLAAYQKFGEQIYTDGLEVRHLDGNQANFLLDNLELGTKSQNAMDKPKEVRQRMAAEAARKHDPIAIRAFFAQCKSYPVTMAHFHISSKGTLHYVLNKATQKDQSK